jgi:magnesium-transporting ATPase (P-type)
MQDLSINFGLNLTQCVSDTWEYYVCIRWMGMFHNKLHTLNLELESLVSNLNYHKGRFITWWASCFFWISPCVWPNSGFWCCVCLTFRITLLSHNTKNHKSTSKVPFEHLQKLPINIFFRLSAHNMLWEHMKHVIRKKNNAHKIKTKRRC